MYELIPETTYGNNGYYRLKVEGRFLTGHTFHKDQLPKLPLRGYGELRHNGWDISTEWAIDADGNVFADNGAHGGPLALRTPEYLLAEAEDEGESKQNELRKLLGLEIPEPSWAAKAREAGWTPPADWKWS